MGEPGSTSRCRRGAPSAPEGFAIASGFLATIVVGWYAFQTGLTGATLHDSFGWNTTLLIVHRRRALHGGDVRRSAGADRDRPDRGAALRRARDRRRGDRGADPRPRRGDAVRRPSRRDGFCGRSHAGDRDLRRQRHHDGGLHPLVALGTRSGAGGADRLSRSPTSSRSCLDVVVVASGAADQSGQGWRRFPDTSDGPQRAACRRARRRVRVRQSRVGVHALPLQRCRRLESSHAAARCDD